VPASCYWALLPLIVREQLRGGPRFFGVLVGCIGAGAVAAALLLPRLRARWNLDRLQVSAQIATAMALLAFALLDAPALGIVTALLAGMAWLVSVSTLNVAAQLAVADAMRARGMALYTTVFYGCLAGGALLWGQVATATKIVPALLIAATLTLIALLPGAKLALTHQR
jgi:predicted MFS family arabinose efflux permease